MVIVFEDFHFVNVSFFFKCLFSLFGSLEKSTRPRFLNVDNEAHLQVANPSMNGPVSVPRHCSTGSFRLPGN